jgi:hypothetical protein
MEEKRFFLEQFTKGLNQGASITDIEDLEFSELENWYPYAGRLKRRGGTKRVSASATPYTEALTNAFAYKKSTGSWTLLVGGLTSIGKLVNDELEVLTAATSGDNTFTSSTIPWNFIQYKDIVYATREFASNLVRIDGDVVGVAGIAAPLSAPTIADGGAGNLVAGDYIAVVTFYNTETGAESNPSDNSSTLTLGASKQIAWTNIPVSTNAQVNARRLYRTMVDQEGEYYFVGQINDNTTTTYTDNIVQSSLGVQVSNENGQPPTSLTVAEIFQERLWATDGTNLYFSGFALPESFYVFDYLQVTPDDGHEIVGLLNFGDRLIVGKTNATYYVTGYDASTFQLTTLSDRHGVYAHHSMRASEGFAFWFGGDNFYQTDGNVVRAIGDIHVRDAIDSIDTSKYSEILSIIDEKFSRYMTILPQTGGGRIILVFNYRNGTWTTFTFDAAVGAPTFIADFFDTYSSPIMMCNLGTTANQKSVFQFDEDSTNTDDGTAITCLATTKYWGTDKAESLKFMKEIGIQADVVAADLKITLLGDEETIKGGPINLYMSPGRKWKRVPLANNGNLATELALKFEYSGASPIDLLGLRMIMVDTGRQVNVSSWT